MRDLERALTTRLSELRGSRASESELADLRRFLGQAYATFVQLYVEYPICGMLCAFQAHGGIARPPRPDWLVNYDPEVDHEFYWMSPELVLRVADDGLRGTAAWRAGFLPLGMCTRGLSNYYIRAVGRTPVPLYRLHDDWIDPDKLDPVPQQARELIAGEFANVLSVARLEPG